MSVDETTYPREFTQLMLPRIGAAVCGAALFCPALAVPLAIACIVTLGAAAVQEACADSMVPELPPPTKPPRRRAQRPAAAENSTEDSFPASDPPSWTPVTGTGTRH